MSSNKYRAKRVKLDGIVFDSKREAAHYRGLKKLAELGEINGLQAHPRYDLHVHGPDGVKRKVGVAEMDFRYFDTRDKEWHVLDVKGYDLPLSKLKRAMVEAEYGIKVEIVR